MDDHIRVLLVEDNPGDAGLVREFLAEAKEVTIDLAWVETLAEAIARIASDGIDLILLDLQLPDSVGLDTLRRLTVAAPGVIVIVMSGISDKETAVRAVQEGAQDYLIKGRVDADGLIRSMRYAIERDGLRKALQGAHDELEDRIRERTDELVKANQALRESNNLLESLLDHLSPVIFVRDLQGRYILVNPAFERLFGFRREDVIGKTDYKLFPREVAELFRAGDQRALDCESAVEIEEQVTGLTGQRTYLTIRAPLCDDSGRPYAVIGIAADITERKLLEEQLRHLQKMEAVGRLAGGIAHDFNNLLSIIVGYGELLGASLAGDPVKSGQLVQITKAAGQAATLTRKLLTFSRRQMTKHKPLDLNTLVSELEPMLRSVVGENIELEVQVAAEPYLIRSERDQVEQAILNLVLNARDAMPSGGKLTVTAERSVVDEPFARLHQPLKPGPYVLLTIRDTGCGMDPETCSHVFEPFFTTKEPGRGTGLGLATVYGTVQQAGGTITVESKPGMGSLFSIYLPHFAGSLAPEPEKSAGLLKGGTETILVAEDEAGIRNLITQVLRLYGYTVLDAYDGREALALAETHPGKIDVLVTDLVMPKMGGRELAQEIASVHPETRVLFISGYSERTATPLPEGLEFLDKPFTPEALMRRLREMLDATRLRSHRA